MKFFKRKLYNIFRNYFKKCFTGNLGKVVEEENRLVCYVKRRKCKRDRYNFTIPCFGITDKEIKIANAFKLNKPICYVLDGIKIERKNVNIFGYNDCEIIIRNCKFNWGVNISVNGKCILESTFIRAFRRLSIDAGELVIKNMNLNHVMKLVGTPLQITIGVDKKLNIIDSNIGEKFDTVKVDVESCDEINMTNSKIMGNNLNIKSPIIEADENSVFATLENINFETDNLKKLKIDSPSIIFNGKDISKYGKVVELEKVDDPLQNQRLNFLEVLRQIKNNCAETNDELTKKINSELNSRSVRRVLKKCN